MIETTDSLRDCLAPAKLNLFLHITGRRPDGYHALQTVFQLLDWGDTLHFERRNDGLITRRTRSRACPPEHDLIVRAATLLKHIRAPERRRYQIESVCRWAGASAAAVPMRPRHCSR